MDLFTRAWIAAFRGATLGHREGSEAHQANFVTALQGGDEVRLVGFGTFSVAQRRASEGRNPRTGEKIHIPASMQPKFKAGKGLKEAVN